jgi:hypothetical protein
MATKKINTKPKIKDTIFIEQNPHYLSTAAKDQRNIPDQFHLLLYRRSKVDEKEI